MKKTTRYILILLVLVAVIGGAVAALYFYQPATEELPAESSSQVSSAVETIYVLQKEDADIQSISFKTEDHDYLLEVQAPADAESEAVTFTIAGLGDYAVNTSAVTTMAKTLYNMVATKELGAATNLSEYGLAGDGQGKAVITYTDGTADTLIIGNKPGASSGRYVLKDGEVYITASLSESLFAGPYSFLPVNVFTVRTLKGVDEEGNEAEMPDVITSMSLYGGNYPQQIDLSYSENSLNGHRITAPMPVDASPDRMGEITAALKTLTATQVVKVDYTQADLAEFGLEEPFAVVEFVMNTEQHKIAVSAVDAEGYRYMLADDNGMIYKIDTATVAIWAENSLMNLRSNYILLPNIKDVKTMTLTQPTETVVFDIERVLNSEKSTEDSPFYDITITNKGAEIHYENAYQPLYKSLISMSVLNVDDADYDNSKATLMLKYEYFNGNTADVVSFYAVEGKDRYAVEINGVYTGQMRKTSLDAVIALIAPAAANETITAVE